MTASKHRGDEYDVRPDPPGTINGCGRPWGAHMVLLVAVEHHLSGRLSGK